MKNYANIIENELANAYSEYYSEHKSDLMSLGDARINALRNTNKHGSGKEAFQSSKNMGKNTRKLIRTAKDFIDNDQANKVADSTAKAIKSLKDKKKLNLKHAKLYESVDNTIDNIMEAYEDGVISYEAVIEYIDLIDKLS